MTALVRDVAALVSLTIFVAAVGVLHETVRLIL